MPDLSVIIPTLNEEAWLSDCIRSIRTSFADLPTTVEIIVVDAESSDATVEIARRHIDTSTDHLVTTSRRGRAHQTNKGAEVADGDWLLLLHADARLTVDWANEFDARLAHPARPEDRRSRPRAGWSHVELFCNENRRAHGLGVRFGLRLIQAGINWRTRTFHSATAEQALVVHRTAFRKVGGMPDVPILEGNRMARRLRRSVPIHVMNGPVRVSARRWATDGLLRTTLTMYAIRLADRFGVPDELLVRWWENSGN